MQAVMATEEAETLDPALLIPGYNTKCVAVRNVDVSNVATTQRVAVLSLVELGKQLLLSAGDGDTDQVRLLMSKGAPFTTDWLGTTPLHLAAQHGHYMTAEVLLRAGISRDARTKVERTPLHIAAQEGNTSIVQLLLSHGADVDSKDMLKMTPLHWAVEREHVETVELLLQNGANPHEVSKFEKTAFHIALDNNRPDIVHLLQSESERNLPLQSLSATASQQAIEEAKLVASQDLQFEFAQVPNPIKQEEVKTTAAVSVTEAISSHPSLESQNDFLHPQSKDEKPERMNINIGSSSPNKKLHGNSTLQFLQAHGITMLPADDTTLVASAVESGQTVVLTEAGKLALNLSQDSTGNAVFQKTIGSNNAAIVQRKPTSITLPTTAKKKVITIRAGQIITKNGPNILKRVHAESLGGSPPKLLVTRGGVPISTTSRSTTNLIPMSNMNHLALITKQLEEARQEAEEYKKLYSRKEREAEEYKQQLQNITQAK